jgi:exonuclease III
MFRTSAELLLTARVLAGARSPVGAGSRVHAAWLVQPDGLPPSIVKGIDRRATSGTSGVHTHRLPIDTLYCEAYTDGSQHSIPSSARTAVAGGALPQNPAPGRQDGVAGSVALSNGIPKEIPMAKVFTVLSWNVEHFSHNNTAEEEVVAFIQKHHPDVFGLYEVEGPDIYGFITEHFPSYLTLITEGQQQQEILVACRKTFKKINFVQRHEFKAGNPSLRPGALLSFEADGDTYALLFLHTDSGTEAPDFGNRAEMFEHTFNLKRALDKKYETNVKFMVLGDLNTMGLKYPKNRKKDIRVADILEIDTLEARADKVQMRVLPKSHPATHFSKTFGESNLDHILASTALQFKQFSQGGQTFEVKVDGWNNLTGAAREQYLENISDHCALVCTVVK